MEFDSTLSAQYFADPWDRRWGLGLLFSALAECEAHSFLKIQVVEPKSNVTHEYLTPHAIDDGLSFICGVFTKLGLRQPGLGLPLARAETFPSQRVFNLTLPLLALKARGSVPSSLKGVMKGDAFTLADASGEVQQDFVFTMDREESNEFLVICAKNRWPVTSALTKIVSQSFRSFAGSGAQNRALRWMIPVNVRRDSASLTREGKACSRLASTYATLIDHELLSVSDLAEGLRDSFRRYEAWGNYLVAKMLCRAGRQALILATRFDIQRKKSTWFGNLSYLGHLQSLAQKDLSRHEFRIFGAVRASRKVCVCAFVNQGQMHFCVSVRLDSSARLKFSNEFGSTLVHIFREFVDTKKSF